MEVFKPAADVALTCTGQGRAYDAKDASKAKEKKHKEP